MDTINPSWLDAGNDFESLLRDLSGARSNSTVSASASSSLSPASHGGINEPFDNDWLDWGAAVQEPLFDGGASPLTGESDAPLALPQQLDQDEEEEDSSIEDIPPDVLDAILDSSRDNKKRKLSNTGSLGSDEPDDEDISSGPNRRKPHKTYDENGKPQKVSHNIIEKRYRSNLNAQITELRDCVPTLRAEAIKNPSIKHNKGKIISSAATYIRELEDKMREARADQDRAEHRLVALHRRLEHAKAKHSRGKVARLAVGGLAGVAAMSGMQYAGDHDTHGLGAVPLPLPLAKRWLEHASITSNGSFLKIAAVLAVLGLLALLSLPRRSRDIDSDGKQVAAAARTTEISSTHPLESRGQLDTAEQTLAIEDGGFELNHLFEEIVRLVLRTVGLSDASYHKDAHLLVAHAQVLGAYDTLTRTQVLTSAVAMTGRNAPQELRSMQLVLLLHWLAPAWLVRRIISLFWSPSTAKLQGQSASVRELFTNEKISTMRAVAHGRRVSDAFVRSRVVQARDAGSLLAAITHVQTIQSAARLTFTSLPLSKESQSQLASITATCVDQSDPGSLINLDALALQALLRKDSLETTLAQAAKHADKVVPTQAACFLASMSRKCIEEKRTPQAIDALMKVPSIRVLDDLAAAALLDLVTTFITSKIPLDDQVAQRLHKITVAVKLHADASLKGNKRDQIDAVCVEHVRHLLGLDGDNDSGYDSASQ
ncbi:Clr6 histone deacetylase associated PHD protein-2 Cph2 [Savitreella phatthalungensis]